jgi:hypothetical protein
MRRIQRARPAAVVFGAVTLGLIGLAVAGGMPLWLAGVCVAVFWLS